MVSTHNSKRFFFAYITVKGCFCTRSRKTTLQSPRVSGHALHIVPKLNFVGAKFREKINLPSQINFVVLYFVTNSPFTLAHKFELVRFLSQYKQEPNCAASNSMVHVLPQYLVLKSNQFDRVRINYSVNNTRLSVRTSRHGTRLICNQLAYIAANLQQQNGSYSHTQWQKRLWLAHITADGFSSHT